MDYTKHYGVVMRNVFVILSVGLFFNCFAYAFAENAPSAPVPTSMATAPTPTTNFVYEQLLNMQNKIQTLENQLNNKALLVNNSNADIKTKKYN